MSIIGFITLFKRVFAAKKKQKVSGGMWDDERVLGGSLRGTRSDKGKECVKKGFFVGRRS